MEYRNLGRSGLVVSVAGLGGNNFGTTIDRDASCAVIRRALDLGVTFFDTADSYGVDGSSEEILGSALRLHRDEVVIATKFGSPTREGPYGGGASRRHVVQAVEASLRRLNTDRIDLYQLHFPDPATPIEETLSALDDLVRAGKVRYIGSSNFASWQIADADWTARTRGLEQFISAQNEWNLLDLRASREIIPACAQMGIGVIPYHPLASGMLTGKYASDASPDPGTRLATWPSADNLLTSANFASVGRLSDLAAAHGLEVGSFALAWLASHPPVGTVPVGARTPEQVEANVRALGVRLDQQAIFDAVFAVRGELADRHAEGPPELRAEQFVR